MYIQHEEPKYRVLNIFQIYLKIVQNPIFTMHQGFSIVLIYKIYFKTFCKDVMVSIKL